MAEQSPSFTHTLVHAPLPVLQIVPAWLAPVVQSVFVVHLPQVPSPFEYGLSVVGQGAVAPVPLSPFAATQLPSTLHTGAPAVRHAAVATTPKPPLQAAHAPVVDSHAGVVPVHNAALAAEH